MKLSERARPRLSYANVVSTLCLFLLLGGGAYAATRLPKNSVGTKQLKNNSVKGSKVADHSLSAADIGGPVDSARSAAEATHAAAADHAASADQAVNAAQLGGTPAAGFFPGSNVKRLDKEVEVTEGNHEFPLLSMGPLTLALACNKGPSSLALGLLAQSSAPGAKIYTGFENSSSQANGTEIPFTGGKAGPFTRFDNSTGEAGAGQLVYRDANTTITMSFGYLVSNLFSRCAFSGLAVQG